MLQNVFKCAHFLLTCSGGLGPVRAGIVAGGPGLAGLCSTVNKREHQEIQWLTVRMWFYSSPIAGYYGDIIWQGNIKNIVYREVEIKFTPHQITRCVQYMFTKWNNDGIIKVFKYFMSFSMPFKYDITSGDETSYASHCFRELNWKCM